MPKIDSPAETGVESATLGQDEQDKLDLAFERGLEDTRSLDTETVLSKIREYREEVRQTAEVAKAEFNSVFDGQAPKSGSFGIDTVHSGYFGYDSWDNLPELTAGETQDWLDNSVPDNLDGAGGVDNPLTVGEPACHLILGVGSYAESPKVSRVRFRLNDQPRPAVTTEHAFRNTDVQIKWLDTPILVKANDDLFAEVYADADGHDAPYIVGTSFVQAKKMRELEPAQMAGTDESNVVVE